jgi:hypothetical protein
MFFDTPTKGVVDVAVTLAAADTLFAFDAIRLAATFYCEMFQQI